MLLNSTVGDREILTRYRLPGGTPPFRVFFKSGAWMSVDMPLPYVGRAWLPDGCVYWFEVPEQAESDRR